MRRRIVRKNKKRIDPRYFLHERVGAGEDFTKEELNPGDNPAPLQEPMQEPTQAQEPSVENLQGDTQKGAELMLSFVKNVLKDDAMAISALELKLPATFKTSEETTASAPEERNF